MRILCWFGFHDWMRLRVMNSSTGDQHCRRCAATKQYTVTLLDTAAPAAEGEVTADG